MDTKPVIAVIFGGRSVEHDVSILTGLQFLEALDGARYTGLAVYVDPTGQWWTGEALRKRSFYPLTEANSTALKAVTLPAGTPTGETRRLLHAEKGLLGHKVSDIAFDLAVPAIHGSFGEDGSLQGLLDYCAIPYAGPSTLGAAAAMDKAFAKDVLAAAGVPVLPHAVITRPDHGRFLEGTDIERAVGAAMPGSEFPYIVKPRRLGSSIAVARADTAEELTQAVLTAFRFDDAVIVEPCVAHLVEYNVAVRNADSGPVTSAIERPLREADVLDFRTKYLAAGGGAKSDAIPSEGMVSANRELNPKGLSTEQESIIRDGAITAFNRLQLGGSVRVDFLCDGETGRIWFNEVNTIPGSFAYYLWTEADPPLGFTALATAIVKEGFAVARRRLSETDSSAGGGRIFSGERRT